jgi:hypothetical protein
MPWRKMVSDTGSSMLREAAAGPEIGSPVKRVEEGRRRFRAEAAGCG